MDSVTFTLLLVRHGQTVNNMLQLIQGQKLDAKLNKKGRVQALALGRSLKDEYFTHVYCSDLQRAEQSCQIILNENSQAKKDAEPDEMTDYIYGKDERLRERYMGCLEGKPTCVLRKLANENLQHRRIYTPEGGETTQQVAQRTEDFFRSLCELIWMEMTSQTKDKKSNLPTEVLVVTHSGTIRGFLKMLNENYWCRLPADINNMVCCNTSLTRIQVALNKVENISTNTSYDILANCTMLFNGDHLINLKRKSSC